MIKKLAPSLFLSLASCVSVSTERIESLEDIAGSTDSSIALFVAPIRIESEEPFEGDTRLMVQTIEIVVKESYSDVVDEGVHYLVRLLNHNYDFEKSDLVLLVERPDSLEKVAFDWASGFKIFCVGESGNTESTFGHFDNVDIWKGDTCFSPTFE